MKNSVIITALLVCTFFNYSKAAEVNILQSVTVENDITDDGVRGFNIVYKFNFLPLEELNHNDTILSGADFQFKTTFTENGIPVKPAQGYNSVKNDNDNLEFSTVLSSTDMTASKFDRKVTQFVPYAALRLGEGERTIAIKVQLTGKDGAGVYHKNVIDKTTLVFTKPLTKTFTMNIDYIEVNTLNASGQAWDYAIFRTDAPDVGVNIMVGNTSVFKSSVNDTYMYAVGPNSKNIVFTISENDKVEVLVQDIDVLFHDYVAKWNFTTNDKKTGTLYTYNKAKGNIKSCNLTFRID